MDVLDSWDSGVPFQNIYTGTFWWVYGGTSIASPQWAALVAIADQGRAIQGLKPLQTLLPDLYSLYGTPAYAKDFHDVTLGSNGYPAAAGYDLTTGLGSPVANSLISDLANFHETASGRRTAMPLSSAGLAPAAGVSQVGLPLRTVVPVAVRPTGSNAAGTASGNQKMLGFAGYEVATDVNNPTPGSVSAVSAAWQAPAIATPTPEPGDAVSTFVGIDANIPVSGVPVSPGWQGVGIPNGEGVGTLSTYQPIWGLPLTSQSAWLSLSVGSINLLDPSEFPLQFGDAMSGSVTYLGTVLGCDLYRMKLQDATQNWQVSAVGGFFGPQESVPDLIKPTTGATGEWGVVRDIGSSASLPNFGTLGFTQASATVQGNSGSISTFSHVAIDMVDSLGIVLAGTSALSADGTSFSVTWQNYGFSPLAAVETLAGSSPSKVTALEAAQILSHRLRLGAYSRP